MRPRDWFSVGVRLLGIYVLYQSAVQWMQALATYLFYQAPKAEITVPLATPESRVNYILVSAIGSLTVGFALLFGAETLTGLIYKESSATSDNPMPN